MIEDFVYLVSSHRRYWGPRIKLLESLQKAGIPDDRVILAIGAEDKNRSIKFSDGLEYSQQVLLCDHDSFDYTALIAVLDYDIKLPSHIFTLHDTMEVSGRTDSVLRNVDPDAKATGVNGWMSNLIMARTDWLYECRERVLAMRNCTKLQAVENEGILWKLSGDSGANYPNAGYPLTMHGFRPFGGAPRIREWYENVGILKWKANWGQDWQNWEVRP